MKKEKTNYIYIINISITIIILFLSLAINKIYPFGKSILGNSDALVQMKPMLYDFIMKIKTGTLLNYSFNNGLGNPFVFNYLYYLASPLNLIALLFKTPNSMFLSVITIKYIITTITMTYYVKKKTNNNFIISIATLSYVFSTWSIAFKYFSIWLDLFMIFPLFQYGLEQLLDKHKYHLYIFALAYMLISNFYLAFSICVYTLFYFVGYIIFYKKDTIKNKIITFDYIALNTIVASLLSFLYLYILYDCMIKMKIPISEHIVSYYKTTPLDFLKSLYYGLISFNPGSGGAAYPNYTCPTLVLVSSICFFFNKNIKNKDKIASIIVIIFSCLVICIPQLDYIMNGFHNVRGFPFRYSFILNFFMIKLFIENEKNQTNNNKIPFIVIISLLALLIIPIIKDKTNYFYMFSIIFLLITFVLYLLKTNNKFHYLLVTLTLILQILLVSYKYIPNYILTIKEELSQFKFNQKNVTYRKNTTIEDEVSIYEGKNYYSNTKTTYFFSSMSYNKLTQIIKNLGGSTFQTISFSIYDNNELLSLLLNVKNPNNNYYLEKIYSVNKNITDTLLDENDIKYNYETLIYNMTNIEDIFMKKELKATVKNNKYVFNTKYNYYLIEIQNKNGGINTIPQEYNEFNQDIKDGENIHIIYVLNKKKLKEIYEYLSKNQIKYTYYNDNHIKGTINVDKDQIIFTSIPYDKDWEVKIDSKKVNTIEVLDGLLAIETTPGKHTIELEYKTHYLIPALISISTFIILLLDIKRKKNIYEKTKQT